MLNLKRTFATESVLKRKRTLYTPALSRRIYTPALSRRILYLKCASRFKTVSSTLEGRTHAHFTRSNSNYLIGFDGIQLIRSNHFNSLNSIDSNGIVKFFHFDGWCEGDIRLFENWISNQKIRETFMKSKFKKFFSAKYLDYFPILKQLTVIFFI